MYNIAANHLPDRILPPPDILVIKYNINLWVPQWNLENRLSKFFLIYWNNTPGAILHFTDHQVEMTPDKLVLIPPFTLISAETRKPFTHNFIEFSAGSPFDNVKRSELIYPAVIAEDVLRHHGKDRQKFTLSMYSFIYQLLLKIPPEHLLPSPHQAIDPRIDKALKLIDSASPGEYTSGKLAKILNISESRFIHLFKEQTPVSPTHYMLLRRLDVAQHLLQDPERSIAQIAEETGFVDRSHFERVFTKKFNITPAGMRKLFKQTTPEK